MKFKIMFALLCILFFKNAIGQKKEKPAFEKAAKPNLPEGSKAPEFSLQMINGKPVHLSDYKNKTIILDVWATWCIPCREELPKLDSVARSLKDQNVILIAVCSADSRENFNKYIQKNGKSFDCMFVFDPQGKALQNSSFRSVYGINGFPTTMVIDKNGIIKGYGFNMEEISLLLQNSLK